MSDIAGIAKLPNVLALQTLVDEVVHLPPELSRIAQFYGHSGYGKSFASRYVATRFDAVLVEIKDTWRQKDILTGILRELGHRNPTGTINAMAETIAAQLLQDDRVLIVDEADCLVARKCPELIRAIYLMCETPIILIGEEHLPQNLKAWPRVDNRMYDWVRAEPATIEDVEVLAGIYCQEARIDGDLMHQILRRSSHNTRRICRNLARVNSIARLEGLDKVTTAHWGDQEFFTGQAPVPQGTETRRRGRVA